jgi:predicted nucleic acid-binding Zn ribbon protein
MAAPQWLSDIGQHLLGFANNVSSVVGGVGATLNANAAFTSSSANLQNAQAANYAAEIAAKEAERKRQARNSMLLIVLMFAVPLIIILSLFAFKK